MVTYFADSIPRDIPILGEFGSQNCRFTFKAQCVQRFRKVLVVHYCLFSYKYENNTIPSVAHKCVFKNLRLSQRSITSVDLQFYIITTTLLLSSSVFHTLFGFDSGNIINKQSDTVMIRYLTRYYYSPTSILNDVTWTILNSKSNFSSFYGRKFQTLRNHSKKIGYGISQRSLLR